MLFYLHYSLKRLNFHKRFKLHVGKKICNRSKIIQQYIEFQKYYFIKFPIHLTDVIILANNDPL